MQRARFQPFPGCSAELRAEGAVYSSSGGTSKTEKPTPSSPNQSQVLSFQGEGDGGAHSLWVGLGSQGHEGARGPAAGCVAVRMLSIVRCYKGLVSQTREENGFSNTHRIPCFWQKRMMSHVMARRWFLSCTFDWSLRERLGLPHRH